MYMQHTVCIMHPDASFGLYYQVYRDARSTECEIYKSLKTQGTGNHNLHKGVTYILTTFSIFLVSVR